MKKILLTGSISRHSSGRCRHCGDLAEQAAGVGLLAAAGCVDRNGAADAVSAALFP